MGTDGNDDPRCFWRADVDQAAAALLDVIRETRPQVLVSYDADGAYGHPDHIQAHRVAWRAFSRSGPGGPAKFYAAAPLPEGQAAQDGREAQVMTEIDAEAYFGRKLAAMRAHATQITVSAPFFALSDGVRRPASGTEYYTLLAGPRGPGVRETGLFARTLLA
jgi:N-acetyl-1-D-myo-inositol-2-amino-2-deoxy-alpha-D-glucopyranoside deacetylase